MGTELIRLSATNGTWGEFEHDWSSQCDSHDEDFTQYALSSLGVLRDLAQNDHRDAGVFALKNSESGAFDAIAQVNSTLLPGYEGKVLRIRHMLLSPHYDFGDYAIEDYSSVLARMFSKTILLAIGPMPSRHIKFHLRSPADRQFFAGAVEPLGQASVFSSVAMRGSWLYLSLKAGH